MVIEMLAYSGLGLLFVGWLVGVIIILKMVWGVNMETWMTKEELLESMMYWQRRALKAEKRVNVIEEYADELEMTINMLNNEIEEV